MSPDWNASTKLLSSRSATGPLEVPDICESCGQGPPFSVWLYRGNVGDRSGVVPPQQHRYQPIDDFTPRD